MPHPLVDAYYRTQLGFYFTSVEYSGDRVRVGSDLDGLIWNHVYLPRCSPADAVTITDSSNVYVDGRIPVAPDGWTIGDREAWLVLPGDARSAPAITTLREVRHDDPRLLELVSRTFDEGHAAVMRQQKPSTVIERQHFVASRPNGPVLGAASIHTTGKWTAVHSVCIDKDHQRAGLGSDLMLAILSQTPRGNTVYLSCDDTWLAGFYARCGFELVHQRTGLQKVL